LAGILFPGGPRLARPPAPAAGGGGADHLHRAAAGPEQDESGDRTGGAVAGDPVGRQVSPDGTAARAGRRVPVRVISPWLPLAALALFLSEILALIGMGKLIGLTAAVLVLVAGSVAGLLLLRREGLRAWRGFRQRVASGADRKSTRLNSSHVKISYAVFCLK